MRIVVNKRKTKRKFKLRLFFWGGLFFCLILGLVYFLIFSPYFKIKNITIKGAEKISQDEILNLTNQVLNSFYWRIIPQNSLISFPGQKLEILLKEKFPPIKEVKIIKKMPILSRQPLSLVIEIKERERAIVYCGQTECFYLDENGFAFEEAPEIYGSLNITLKDNSKRDVKIKEIVVNKDLILFLFQVKELLEKSLSLNLLNFQIDFYPSRDVIAITSEGWQIFFNPNERPSTQVETLKTVLAEKIKEQRDQLEYVDLRIANRVYYRYRE